MDLDLFLGSRRASWRRLARLEHALRRRGVKRATFTDLIEFGALSRRVSGDYAFARRQYPGEPVTQALHAMLTDAHGLLYRPRPWSWAGVRRFFAAELPAEFRRGGRWTALATALFLGAALTGYAITRTRPESFENTDYEGIFSQVEQARSEGSWSASGNRFAAGLGAFFFTHNAQVARNALLGGVFLGLGALEPLLVNGVMVGVVTGASSNVGIDLVLWEFISAHGFIELFTICWAGGAGMMLGFSLINPGFHGRRAAVTLAARRAMRQLIGVVLVLFVAGTIEGFFSPDPDIPVAVKLLVGPLLLILLLAYLMLAGRGAPTISRDTPDARLLVFEPDPAPSATAPPAIAR